MFAPTGRCHTAVTLPYWSPVIATFEANAPAADSVVVGPQTPAGDRRAAWMTLTKPFERRHAAVTTARPSSVSRTAAASRPGGVRLKGGLHAPVNRDTWMIVLAPSERCHATVP